MRKVFYAFLMLLLCLGATQAQNVLVTGALVGNGTYPTLGSAFTAINGGAQTGATIVVSITGNTVETATATLNQGTWATLVVTPQGGAARTISGAIAGPLVEFNGADRVGFDGLNTGGNSLTLENTDITTASTVRFVNDARAVAFQNLTLLGASSTTTTGTVFIDAGIGGGGNDSLAFNNVIISNSGANFPNQAVYSAGNITAGQENSQVTFQNCLISNFFNATLLTRGIYANTGNSDWTITGCKFFQTATRTFTVANTHTVIRIGSGNNHLVSGNTIGFASAGGTGVYTIAGTVATRLIGIDLAVGTTTASSVQGNTVAGINLATSSGAATANGVLCGINVTGGNVNIGTVSGNVIGSASGTGSLAAVPTATQGGVVGINSSSTGTIVIQNNTIGGLQSISPTAAIAGAVFGINVSGAAASMTITGNTIGNATADNMVAGILGTTTGSSLVAGINASSSPVTFVVTNNTIRNLSSYGTGTGGYVRGFFTATTGSSGTTLTGNTVRDLKTSSALTAYTSGNVSASGIHLASGVNAVISGNTVFNIAQLNTGTGNISAIGISLAQATSTTASNNTIYNITNAGTGTTATAPPIICGMMIRSGTTNVSLFNNMISLGTGVTTNTTIIGIWGNHGSTPDPVDRIYHNTVYITGTAAAGALSSFCFVRGSLVGSPTATVDVRNNIFVNDRTGGTGQHFAIANNFGGTANATGWGAAATNNNILNANGSTVGFWTTALTFANWKTTSSCDAASFSGSTVTFVNPASNLHLNMGVSANTIESTGQTIALVTTDIDGQTRPGPTGSVNGGAFAPDLGADEFDGVPTDFAAPVITYTALGNICTTGDRTLTATITDFTGVPTAGTLRPRIYFRKNLGTWFSNPGTLSSGTATNGTWTFTILAASMGGLTTGDNVQYYVIAQDQVTPIPYIASNPAAGLVASDVNTVTTAPTSPSSYAIGAVLFGTYTVGATGAFPTLTAAANAYNTGCLSGAVVFSLIDALYPSETYPITFGQNSDASAFNTLIIKPAAGVSPSFTGNSATALLQWSGADYVILNGSNSSTANSICPRVQATRDLTLTNTNATTTSAVISLITTAGGDPSTHNAVFNCNIIGNSNTTTVVGINISGPTIGNGVGANGNNFNTILNNNFQKMQIGIFGGSAGTPKSSNNNYNLNVMNSSGANSIGRFGIMLLNENAPTVHGNIIGNIFNTASTDVAAISLGFNAISNSATTGGEVTNASVMYNVIDTIVQTGTFSATGIAVASAATGATVISNNCVSNVFAKGTAGDFASGIFYGGGAGTLRVYGNSVTVTGATLTGATQPNMAIGINGATPNLDIRNNIFVCTGDNGLAGNTGIGLGYTSTTGNYLNLVSNYNDFYVAGTSSVIGRTGGLAAGTVRTTLLDWQTETGRDANSLNVQPNFVAPDDLHLVTSTNPLLSNVGTPITGFNDDFECNSRSALTPDIGCDEWILACSTAFAGVITPGDTSACQADSLDLFATGYSVGAGSTYSWESSPFGLNTWTATGGTNPDLFNTGLVTGPTDFRLVVGCATNSSTAISDTITFYVGDSIVPTAVCQNISVQLDSTGTIVLAGSDINNGSTDNCTSQPSLVYTLGQDTFDCAHLGTNLVVLFVADSLANTDSCTATVTITAAALTGSVTGIDVACFGASTGTATATPVGGCAPYTYAWSNSQTSGTATGLVAGTYAVTITDANGQTVVDSVTLTEPATAVSATGTSTQETCVPGNDGTIDLTPTGGTPTYTYAWSNSATTEDLAGLAAGAYTVTVTDIAGCTSTASVTVNLAPNPAVPGVTQAGNVFTCTATGVTYQWNLNGSPIPGATSASYTATASGTYTVTVTDTNGCTATSTDNIYVGLGNAQPTNALLVWPNPAQGSCFVMLPGSNLTPCTLTITDLQGRVMARLDQVDLSTRTEVSLRGFAAGMYLVETSQNGVRLTRNLVVQ